MVPPIMTNQFFSWFFWGWNNLGGWFLFFLAGSIAVAWLIYDSSRRFLRALGWKMAAVISFLFIFPAIMFKFSVNPIDPTTFTTPLFNFSEPIWYLGMLAGVLPPLLAVGFYMTYQDMVGCPFGHEPYEEALGECPECARARGVDRAPSASYSPRPSGGGRRSAPPAPAPVAPRKPSSPKAAAWLAARDGHTFQLNQGETTLGRSSQNDIKISNDTTVGRSHAKISEQNGHFRIIDLGAKNYTRVNGRIVRQPVLLQAGDEIQLGENTKFEFVTTPR